MSKIVSMISALILTLFLAVIPLAFGEGFFITILYTIFVYVTLAESWNLIGGLGGQVFLGTAALFGMGAYVCALLAINGLPFILCILISGLATACLAFILIPTFKLRGVYFVVGSIFLPEIAKVIVLMLPATGGAAGLYLPLFAQRTLFTYYFSLFLMFFVILTSHFIIKSKVGIALKAIRDDQDAAEMSGINSTKFKLIALFLTALFSGMIGGVHAFHMIFVEPHSFFSVSWSIIPCFMAIIGGTATLFGPIIGALFYTILREAFIFVSGEIYLTMLGILLIAIILLAPKGVYPIVERAFKKSSKSSTNK